MNVTNKHCLIDLARDVIVEHVVKYCTLQKNVVNLLKVTVKMLHSFIIYYYYF